VKSLHVALYTGNRGPTDDSKDYNTEDETVVDSEQGNSMQHSYSIYQCESKLISSLPSSHAHHLPASPWSRSEPSHPTDIYIGTKIDAREDNKVSLPRFEAISYTEFQLLTLSASWHTRKRYCLCHRLTIQLNVLSLLSNSTWAVGTLNHRMPSYSFASSQIMLIT